MSDRQTLKMIYAVYGALIPAMLLTCPAIAPAQDDTQGITLRLGDYRFSPHSIEVVAGKPLMITLINEDNITPHNFTLSDPAAGLDIDVDIKAGKTTIIEFTPELAGTYPFHCDKKLPFMKSHRARGMEGSLIVVH